MTVPTKVEEVLSNFRQSTIIIDAGSVRGPEEDARAFEQSFESAQAELSRLILKCVGEDENDKEDDMIPYRTIRNRLRAEIRAALKKIGVE